MANWVEPKSNYVATDQVTPDIFNTLAENEKFLYEIRCPMEVQDSEGNVTKINSLVFVETTTEGVYKAKYKKSDGTLVEIPIESAQTVKLRTSRSIGINGLDAESASFNGTSAVKIKVTGVPAELLYGIGAIDITGNAATATEATHAGSADSATNANHADETDYATSAGSADTANSATNAGHADEADYATRAGAATEATHATNADSATYADSADRANGATTAIHALSSDTATSATSATKAESADQATVLSSTWTSCTRTTYLSHGTYIFQVVIDDQESQAGGHAVSFSDIIVVNSYAYNGLNANSRYNNDNVTGANHVYNANAHESPWYRTARLKVTYMSSTQFRINLFVSTEGGYATSNTDVKGYMIYPSAEANTVSGITYAMYYKKIM